MILRLDPAVPVVWRSPTTVQLGAEHPIAVIDDPTPATERMLAALAVGTPQSALAVLASNAGADPGAAERLVDAVRPALLDLSTPPSPPARGPESLRLAVDGNGPTSRAIAAVLRGLGAALASEPPSPGGAPIDAVVLVGSYAVAPARYGRWQLREVPQLAVVFGEREARIGPFVRPGEGACLRCLDLARADDDPAWPLIGTQLVTKRAASERPPFAASVALRAVDALLAHLLAGSSELVGASRVLDRCTGEVSVRRHPPHDRCGCRALPGTGTAGVARLEGRRSRPSSGAAAAGRG